MLCKFENKEGSITIHEAVIGHAVSESVKTFAGKVWLSTPKGKLLAVRSRFGGRPDTDNVEVSMGDEGIDIRFFVVIRFGTSIRMVTEALIKDLKREVEENTGLKVNSVAIVVTGMISKHIARRNIEIRG